MGSLTTIDNTFPNAHHPALVTLDTGNTKAAAFCGHSVGFSHSNQLCSDFVTLSIGIGDIVDRSVIESHSYLLGVWLLSHGYNGVTGKSPHMHNHGSRFVFQGEYVISKSIFRPINGTA